MVEQLAPDEHGRLEIRFQHGARMWWIGVAITAAATTSERTTKAHSKADGKAAREEELVKRVRYHNRAYPFVMESLGRPGQAAASFVRRFAMDAAPTGPP